ncbi:MAG: O-antigen ligase family protein [Planctomycetes bacterium]|nr:O-antigen ligase family protein [Planctomycetota bacterium]
MKGLIFTYLLTYGGALVSLFWPYYGLLIYICFAIVKPESMWPWAVPIGNYSRIVAIAMLLGWAGHGFGKWNFGKASLTVYALIGWFGWGVVTAILGSDSAVGWMWVEGIFKIVLPFVVGVTIIESVDQLKQVAWVIVASLGYLAYELNLSYVNGFNSVREIGFGGMDNNTLSIAMVCGAGLAFFVGIEEASLWRRWAAFACAAMMAHVPMFGESRGGMLALVILGGVSLFLILAGSLGWVVSSKSNRLRSSHFVFFVLALAGGLYMAGEGVWQRFGTIFVDPEERDASAVSRVVLWGQCWEIMTREPVFGIGPNYFPIYIAPQWGGSPKEAHSLWMQTGAEMGFPGLLLLVTFYGSVIWRLWKLLLSKEELDPWLRNASRMVIAALVGFAVAASFVTVKGVEPPYYIAMIGAGLLKLASQRKPAARTTDYSRVAPGVSRAPAVA